MDGKVAGTAWLFGQEGYLLTAGHVLGQQKPPACVEVRFAEDVPRLAHKVQHVYAHESGTDFAILKLAEPLMDRPPLPVTLVESVRGKFIALGYGKSLVDRSSGVGTFVGFFDPQDSSANRLFKLESTQLGEPGYSGCAIFSKEVKAVVAIQIEATRAQTGTERDTILAMPLYRVARQWPILARFAQVEVEETQLRKGQGKQGRKKSEGGATAAINVEAGNFIITGNSSVTFGTGDITNVRVDGANDVQATRHRLQDALEKAKRVLSALEAQAAGYTSLTIPANLLIELEDKRKEVAKLEFDLKSTC